MVFAMGFLTAALVALLVLPALSARAERLARARVEARFPRSLAEVAAERDLLRAELAVDARRVERRLEALAARHAADLNLLGHRTTEIAELQRELAEGHADLEATRAELADRTAALQATSEILARTQAELNDTSAALTLTRADLTGLQSVHEALTGVAEDRRLLVASLETTLDGQRIRAGDLERDLLASRDLLAERERTIAELQTDRNLMEHRVAGLQQDRDDRDHQIEALRAERTTLAGRVAATQERAAAAEAQRLALEARVSELEQQVERAAREATSASGSLAEEVEHLRSEKASAEGALLAARAERKRLMEELAALARSQKDERDSRGTEDAALRAAMDELAAQIMRMSSPATEPDPAARRSAASV